MFARLREWAAQSGALVFPWTHKRGQIVLFPEDVLSRPEDGELREFIERRVAADLFQHP